MTDEPHPIPAVGSIVWLRAHHDSWLVVETTGVGSDGLLDFVDDEGSRWSAAVEDRGESWRFLEDPPPPPAATFPAKDQVERLMLAGARAERDRVIGILRESAAATMAGVMWLDSPDGVAAKIEATAPALPSAVDREAVPRV